MARLGVQLAFDMADTVPEPAGTLPFCQLSAYAGAAEEAKSYRQLTFT
jgi:hypothetical protein